MVSSDPTLDLPEIRVEETAITHKEGERRDEDERAHRDEHVHQRVAAAVALETVVARTTRVVRVTGRDVEREHIQSVDAVHAVS